MKLRFKITSWKTENNGCGFENQIPFYILQYSEDNKKWVDVPMVDEKDKKIKGQFELRLE